MNGLREKFRNQKGFTLIEMLIVVAIIAILIAVSIPLVGNALDKTRHATDAANERAAKAEILLQYMAGSDAVVYKDGTAQAAGQLDTTVEYFYDAANGRLDTTGSTITPYGQCTHGGHTAAGANVIKVKFESSSGEVTIKWGTVTKLCGTAKDIKHTGQT